MREKQNNVVHTEHGLRVLHQWIAAGPCPVTTDVRHTMDDDLLYRGRVHSPFFIFVRHPDGFSDEDILTRFNVPSYRRATKASRYDRYAVISDVGAWTMLADDYHYTLWHMKITQSAIESIAKCREVFTCTEGDCDRSFDFSHYRDGELSRKYIVSSPLYSDRRIDEDWGTPLPGESELLQADGENIGIARAAKLGIQTRFKREELRVYVPSRRWFPFFSRRTKS